MKAHILSANPTIFHIFTPGFTMARINFKKFRKHYGLELLPVSLSSYRPGYVVEWDNAFHSKFEVEELCFIYSLGLDNETEKALEQQFDALALQPPVEAGFAALDFKKKHEIKAALNIPSLQLNLSGKVNVERVLKFSYSNIKARTIHGEVRKDLHKLLKKMKTSDRKKFRKLDHIMFFDQLYYADSVNLHIGNDYESELKGKLEAMGADFSIGSAGSSQKKVTFTNPKQCPFAAKLEDVEDYAD